MNNLPPSAATTLMFLAGFVVGFGVLGLWWLFIIEERRRPRSSHWLNRQFSEHKLQIQNLEDQARGNEWNRRKT